MQLSHLLRSDVRQFRLSLVAWIAVQAMSTVYFGLQSFVDTDARNAGVLAFLGFVLALGRWLGLGVLIPLVMHAHPAVGSNAFWLTRPIPWRTLLLSKTILFSTIFIAVPVLFEAILMRLFGVPLRNIVLVSVQNTLTQALLVAALMAVSALTRSLAGFALVVGGLLLSLALLVNISLVVLMRTLGEEPVMHDVSLRSVSSPAGDVAFLVVLIAAFVLPVAIQYRLRSTRTTISTGLLAVAAVVGAAFVWPSSDRLLAAPVWSSTLQILVQEPTIEFTARESILATQPTPWVRGSVRLGLGGVEPTWLGTIRLVESSLELEDGSRLPTAGNGVQTMLAVAGAAALPDHAATRDLLGVTGFRPPHQAFPPFQDWAPAITLRERDLRKYVGTTANYRGRFIVDLDQLQIAGTLPLRSGAEFSAGDERFVFLNVLRNRHAAQVQVRRVTATTMFDSTDTSWLSFYLRNSRRSEALAGSNHSGYAHSANLGMLAIAGLSSVSRTSGFDVRREFVEFSTQAPPGPPEFQFTDEWLADAELVAVRRVPSGSVVRTIEIPRAQVVEATRATR